MKKIILFIMLFAVLSITSVGNARQTSNEALQDIEDLYKTGKINKEQYTKMKQNLVEVDKKPKDPPQPSLKDVYLDAYKDGVITQSQFYKICKIYSEYPVEKANLEAANFVTKEGKEEAVGVWFELKMDGFKKAEQARVARTGYPADHVLSNSECEKIIDKYFYISNTQGEEAGLEYASSFTAEQQQKLNERFLKRQQAQAIGNAIGRGLAAAANVFQQNAQQMQQQSQQREKYTIKDQYGLPKGSIERSNY